MAASSVNSSQKIFDFINAKYEACDSLAVELMLSRETGDSEKIIEAFQKYSQAHTDLKLCLRLCEGDEDSRLKILHKLTLLKEFRAQFKESCEFLQTVDFNRPIEEYVDVLDRTYQAYMTRFHALKETPTEKNFSRYVRAHTAFKMSLQPLLLTLDPSDPAYATVKKLKKEIHHPYHAAIPNFLRPHADALMEAFNSSHEISSLDSLPPELLDLSSKATSSVSVEEDLRAPVGIPNPCDDCWIISSLQLLIHSSPRLFSKALTKLPRLESVLSTYRKTQTRESSHLQTKVSRKLRKDLKELSKGDVKTSGHDDAAIFFQQCFQESNPKKPDALYQLNRELVVSGGARGSAYAYTSKRANADPKAMIDLDLIIQDRKTKKMRSLSVKQSLSRFFTRRARDYINEQTGEETGATIRLTFPKAPDDLVFHVKRFTHYIKYGVRVSKANHDAFAMQPEMTLDPKRVSGEVSASLIYECKGFVLHMGSLGGGHYVAYVKKGEQWYCCSDKTTYPVKTKDALEAMSFGYIYTYVKKA